MTAGRTGSRLFQLVLGLTVSGGVLVVSGSTAMAAGEPTTSSSSDVIVTTTTEVQASPVPAPADNGTAKEATSPAAGEGQAPVPSEASLLASTIESVSAVTTAMVSETASGASKEVVTEKPEVASSAASIVPAGPQELPQSVLAEVVHMTEKPVVAVRHGASDTTLYYDGVAMPLQPVVTAAPVVDLAASLPTSPAHDPSSQPVSSMVFLGHLALGLSQVVLPMMVFLLGLGGGMAAGSELGRFMPHVVSGGLLALTYGFWLRRSGFSTAARSDLPTDFSFALPRLMGYVRVPVHLRT